MEKFGISVKEFEEAQRDLARMFAQMIINEEEKENEKNQK